MTSQDPLRCSCDPSLLTAVPLPDDCGSCLAVDVSSLVFKLTASLFVAGIFSRQSSFQGQFHLKISDEDGETRIGANQAVWTTASGSLTPKLFPHLLVLPIFYANLLKNNNRRPTIRFGIVWALLVLSRSTTQLLFNHVLDTSPFVIPRMAWTLWRQLGALVFLLGMTLMTINWRSTWGSMHHAASGMKTSGSSGKISPPKITSDFASSKTRWHHQADQIVRIAGVVLSFVSLALITLAVVASLPEIPAAERTTLQLGWIPLTFSVYTFGNGVILAVTGRRLMAAVRYVQKHSQRSRSVVSGGKSPKRINKSVVTLGTTLNLIGLSYGFIGVSALLGWVHVEQVHGWVDAVANAIGFPALLIVYYSSVDTSFVSSMHSSKMKTPPTPSRGPGTPTIGSRGGSFSPSPATKARQPPTLS